MSIHDVQMQPLRPGILGAARLGGEASEIGGKQGGRNNHGLKAKEAGDRPSNPAWEISLAHKKTAGHGAGGH